MPSFANHVETVTSDPSPDGPSPPPPPPGCLLECNLSRTGHKIEVKPRLATWTDRRGWVQGDESRDRDQDNCAPRNQPRTHPTRSATIWFHGIGCETRRLGSRAHGCKGRVHVNHRGAMPAAKGHVLEGIVWGSERGLECTPVDGWQRGTPNALAE